jgi:hypothetical protein
MSPVYLSAEQIAAEMLLAGWPHSELETGTAVAFAESSGNAVAIGPVVKVNGVPNRAYGLMQNLYPAHQDLFPGGVASGQWMDPDTSFKIAKAIFDQQGWDAWDTYKTGAFRMYLARAAAGVAALDKAIAQGGGNVTNVCQTVTLPIDQPIVGLMMEWQLGQGLNTATVGTGNALNELGGGFVGAMHDQLNTGATSPLVRALEVILGSVLLAMGLYRLTRPATAPIVGAAKTAAKIIPK